ncbi:hypothetical protein [Jannaschia sp. 2305UL9-9]|uniref:hypothetical protein n=1 Tax=Jannaschia sp. 2305UL9-9 TaxID=3121638 RepID=UPI003528BF51
MFSLGDWLLMWIAFSLGPAFVGGLMTFIFSGAAGPLAHLLKAGGLLLFGAFGTALVAPVVLAVFALLMRTGWAGWAVVGGLATLVVGSIIAASGRDILFWVFTIYLHAAILWCTAFQIEPDALSRRS